MPETSTGFVLRLIIGDPAHSEQTDDAERDIYGPIWDWISSFDLGQWPGSEDDDAARYVLIANAWTLNEALRKCDYLSAQHLWGKADVYIDHEAANASLSDPDRIP